MKPSAVFLPGEEASPDELALPGTEELMLGGLPEAAALCADVVDGIDRSRGVLMLPLAWVLAYPQEHVSDPKTTFEEVWKLIERDMKEAQGGEKWGIPQLGAAGGIQIGAAIGGMAGKAIARKRIKNKVVESLPKLGFARAIHDLTREEKIYLKAVCLAFVHGHENHHAGIAQNFRGEITRGMAYAVWAGGKVNTILPSDLYHHDWADIINRAARDLMTMVYGNEESHNQRMAEWASEIVASVDDLKGHPLANLLETASLTIGSAHWFDPRDADPASVFVPHRPGATMQLGAFGDQLVGFGGNESLITIAGPGAGKTQCHVLPNVAAYNGPAVILDIKNEVYPLTAPQREADGKRVLRFSLLNDGAPSASYNPLALVSRDPDQLWDDAVTTACLLIDKPAHERDPFWTSSARDVVATYVAGTVLADENPTLESLMDRIMGAGADRVDELGAFAHAGIEHDCKQLEQTARALIGMAGDNARTLESVFATVREKLSALQSAAVRAVTKESDWQPLDLREPGATLYLIVPLKRLEALAPFLRLMIGQHIHALTEQAPPRDALPVTFFLDELPQLGNFDAVVKAVEVGRSYGLRVWGFAQNPQQIETAYERSSVLLSNPAVRCYMNIDDIRVAQRVSQEIGEVENALTGERRPLVKPSELMNSPDYRDAIITLGRGTPPAKLEKHFFHAVNQC